MSFLNDFFSWNTSLFSVWWYWAIMIFGFALHWWTGYMMNDGGGGFRESMTGFYEDFLWAIPGSKRRRGEYVRQLLSDYGENSMGSMGGYSHEEIRRNDLYEEVGLKMLPGPLWFWGRVFGWMFWPTAAIVLVVMLIFVWALHGTLTLFLGGARTQALYEKMFG